MNATLLLAAQLSYVVITLLHTGGEANNHPAIFAAYAASAIWTGVHVAQFACMAIMLGGLLALFFALDTPRGTAGWAARFGAAATVTTLAIYGVVLGVDGVALKQAVNEKLRKFHAGSGGAAVCYRDGTDGSGTAGDTLPDGTIGSDLLVARRRPAHVGS